MMVRKALRIDQFRTQFNQALLKTLRLRDPAQRRHLPAREQFETMPLTGKDILEIKWSVNALDNPRARILLRDQAAQSTGIPVALRYENRASPGQMRRRFSQSPSGQKMLIPERLLAIDHYDVPPPPAQFPILK